MLDGRHAGMLVRPGVSAEGGVCAHAVMELRNTIAWGLGPSGLSPFQNMCEGERRDNSSWVKI